MNIKEKVKNMLKNWLDIQPAIEQRFTLLESMNLSTTQIRNKIWYKGKAEELDQFYRQLSGVGGYVNLTKFWAAAPIRDRIRKTHAGIPSLIVDTLTKIVKSDMSAVKITQEDGANKWKEIEEETGFWNAVEEGIKTTLYMGDGAFKISIDTELAKAPFLEFVSGDRVELIRKHGHVLEVRFWSDYVEKNEKYRLCERYGKGFVRYELYKDNTPVPLVSVSELAELKNVEYDGDFIMAVPLLFYKNDDYPGRGRAIYENKLDLFDGIDEIVSQWLDAVRQGRVKSFIPEDLWPRDPKTGQILGFDVFCDSFVCASNPSGEGVANRVETVQARIDYEAYLTSYSTLLDMCLQGIISPATLGINIGKMASQESQREKKDVTGDTRNHITDILEKELPKVVDILLKAYDKLNGADVANYDIDISFGEYGAPSFDARIDAIGKASTSSIMSVEAVVNELWGSSKDDNWKEEEIRRIKALRGIEQAEEPQVGGELIDVAGSSEII